mmetsp:Transcript_5859/g.7930  ORF Transcript_5859/g.7930 Transcript_5859/m.7930 type:complete len:86 (-) Transcript_5859:2845-3102(-)
MFTLRHGLKLLQEGLESSHESRGSARQACKQTRNVCARLDLPQILYYLEQIVAAKELLARLQLLYHDLQGNLRGFNTLFLKLFGL